MRLSIFFIKLNIIEFHIYIYQDCPHKYVKFKIDEFQIYCQSAKPPPPPPHPLPFRGEFGCWIAVHILEEIEHLYLIGKFRLINTFHYVISSLKILDLLNT